jgi:hypothetical protein
LEKGEVGIVVGQFAALAIVILLLSNFIPIASATSTGIGKVYWGSPDTGVALSSGGKNVEKANASTISALYTLATGSEPASVTAVRLCLNPQANYTGANQVYTDVQFNYSLSKHSHYISFGPTDQPANLVCTYTISLTDSVQSTVTWSATVEVNATAA